MTISRSQMESQLTGNRQIKKKTKKMQAGGVMKEKMGGRVRGDGCAIRGKTKGRFV